MSNNVLIDDDYIAIRRQSNGEIDVIAIQAATRKSALKIARRFWHGQRCVSIRVISGHDIIRVGNLEDEYDG